MGRVYQDRAPILKELAAEFAKIAEHADTLEECDRWHARAQKLREAAHLVALEPASYTATADKLITQSRRAIDTVLDAIHASRLGRRTGKK